MKPFIIQINFSNAHLFNIESTACYVNTNTLQ